jgi:hypothetical protein
VLPVCVKRREAVVVGVVVACHVVGSFSCRTPLILM